MAITMPRASLEHVSHLIPLLIGSDSSRGCSSDSSSVYGLYDALSELEHRYGDAQSPGQLLHHKALRGLGQGHHHALPAHHPSQHEAVCVHAGMAQREQARTTARPDLLTPDTASTQSSSPQCASLLSGEGLSSACMQNHPSSVAPCAGREGSANIAS